MKAVACDRVITNKNTPDIRNYVSSQRAGGDIISHFRGMFHHYGFIRSYLTMQLQIHRGIEHVV